MSSLTPLLRIVRSGTVTEFHEALVADAQREVGARKKARAVLACVPNRAPMRGDKMPK